MASFGNQVSVLKKGISVEDIVVKFNNRDWDMERRIYNETKIELLRQSTIYLQIKQQSHLSLPCKNQLCLYPSLFNMGTMENPDLLEIWELEKSFLRVGLWF